MIELLIALVIGLVVMLGVIQVFAASKEAYRLSEGLARVQENGRFAMDALQRELRMAGHFGCVNDQAQALQSPNSLTSTLNIGAHPALDFSRSIQGYEAAGTEPSAQLTISETPLTGGKNYKPLLPDEIEKALTNRVNGSDVVALRYLMPDGVPVTAIAGTTQKPIFSFDAARLSVLQSGVSTPGLFGVADCLSTTVFQAKAVDTKAASVTFDDAPNNVDSFTRVYAKGQAVLYRAESIVFYVGYDADSKQSSLYRVRFTASPSGDLVAGVPEPLVEGVENLQLLYGQDRALDTLAPTGYIDRQGTANDVDASLTNTALAWRRVGAVQVGLLMSSPDRASARQAEGVSSLSALGVAFKTPDDKRLRAVYQSTVAIRNRLYGN
ncbi:type IV pilus assembly protein PilW [Xanthomonas arboricola]|nr:PilW family protein [Xanthomonas euroxanthea]NJC38241.1 type IV pilus assembly protein PilW [Xanthomonas euroxanthea]